MTVLAGSALLALASSSVAADPVRISVRIPEGATVAAKLEPTEKLAQILLGSGVKTSWLPFSADMGATLRYEAAQWNPAVSAAQREQARAKLLELWGDSLTIESQKSRPRLVSPKALKSEANAARLVTPDLRSGNFDQAYDNARRSPQTSAAAAPVRADARAKSSRQPASQPGGRHGKKTVVPVAQEYKVSQDVIWAVIAAKANCGTGETCDRNLMGISVGLAEAYGYRAQDIKNASINVYIGTRLLAQLLKQFDGDLHRALAAYQVGPGRVIRSRGIPNDKGVKDFLAAFEKAYRGASPGRVVGPVRVREHSLAGEIQAEIQEEVLDLADRLRGNPRVARYRPIIKRMAKLSGVDGNLMEAMIMRENPWGDPLRVSKAGAVGLGQLMPDTASWLGVIDSTNPIQNLKGMAKYLKYLLKKYDGDKVLAVAAYNAGERRVDKVGRIPNIGETKKYVRSVMKSYAELTGKVIDPTPYMPRAKRHGSRSRA